MTDVVGWFAEVFDPKVSRGGFERRLPDLLDAIARHVLPEHRVDTCYDRPIADKELAVLLYVVERGTFDGDQPAWRRWTLPRESVEALAALLAADGVRCGRWPPRKFYAAREILTRAALIHRVDDVHRAAGPERGVAHRYHVGPAHPLHAAFRVACRLAPPEVVTVKGNHYRLTRPFDGRTTEISVSIAGVITVGAKR